MDPNVLAQVLRDLPRENDPNLIVGFDHASDAGVYRLSDELALVQTVDFFTPIVDDPVTFGRIAAANSLSDVYAMGGRPLTALNVVAFPSKKVDAHTIGRILEGGCEKASEGRCTVVGGHTVEGPELLYGMSVTGLVDPRKLVTNERARPGHALVLTKALGTGIITTGLKLGKLAGSRVDAISEAVVASMCSLNRLASELMVEAGASGATDVTGFGLLGHALELARASGVELRFEAEAIPLLEGALDLAGQCVVTGGDRRNRQFTAGAVRLGPRVGEPLGRVLFDPQTSGGLLIALPPERARELVSRLGAAGAPAACVVGEVTGPGQGAVVVE